MGEWVVPRSYGIEYSEKGLLTTKRTRNILCVFGDSGVGKSSLINVIAGTTEDNLLFEGEIILNGKILNNIPIEKRRIGLWKEKKIFVYLSSGPVDPQFRIGEDFMRVSGGIFSVVQWQHGHRLEKKRKYSYTCLQAM